MEGKISAVDPLEYDNDGEPGGRVESWFPGFNDDNVDIRLNQEDLAVPVPLSSNAEGPGLEDRFRALDEGSVQSASSCILPP